jgi:two-component system OmpR family response regulator
MNNADPNGSERPAIVVVDDVPDGADILCRLLRRAGYHAIPINCGADLFTLLEHHTPALIILDMHMPGMDGIECLRKIRASDRSRDVPVVMYSADFNHAPMTEAESLGVRDYVVKGTMIWKDFSAIVARYVPKHAKS